MTIDPGRSLDPLPPPARIDRGVPGVFHRGPHGRRVSHRSSVWVLRERRLGPRLDREFAGSGVVLHSRHAGAGLDCDPIDHMVITPAAVWVIETNHELERLTLDTAEAAVSASEGAAKRRSTACREVLSSVGFDWLDVHHALCVTNAQGVMRRPLRIGDVWVARPGGLLSVMLQQGPLAHLDVVTVAAEMSRRFPAAR